MSANQKCSTESVEETIKDFVATRPRRPRSGRMVAGVAAGIGRRYGIDPVIVRVAFVVGAIYGGAGVLAYLLGWLLLAADDDEVSGIEALVGRGRSSMSRGLTLVLGIALIPSASFVFGGHYSTLAGVIVLAGALYLLHRYRGDQGQIVTGLGQTRGGTTGMTDSTPTDAVPTDAVPSDGRPTDATPTDAIPTDTVPNQPPAWDPLGAAPFAWDLPEPTPAAPAPPPPVRARRRKSRIGLATVGVIFVTGAVLAALAPSDGGWLDAGHIVGILAAIAGVGLVAAAFAHAGRGLIWMAALLSVVGFGLTSTHYTTWHGAGDAQFRPTTVADVQPLYQQSLGNLDLDLTGLPASGTVHTEVQVSGGDITVEVPPNAQVQAACSSSLGNVDCLDQHHSGPGGRTLRATQTATQGDKLTIVLDVHGALGNVEVTSNG
ncbi:MAG TPA: PspC domain-containing protein [Pseudonocardiaceae bacterium]|nr:PspC domain-containing protein [Pseudonocardiaceae bacterium]